MSQERATGTRTEEGEEVRAGIPLTAPQRVSKQEREERELTHTPFRAWCPLCVRGRGKNQAHEKGKHKEDDGNKVPRISMDYFFMSSKDEKAHENPIIVMVDERAGEKYARAVSQKGLGQYHEMDWLFKGMSLELKAWGISRGR